jgi:diguanylate cyclase
MVRKSMTVQRTGGLGRDIDALSDDDFYYRPTLWTVVLSIVVAAPFGVYRLVIGDTAIGVAVAGMLLAFCTIAIHLLRGGRVTGSRHMLAATYTIGVIALTVLMGGLGSYWLFPAVVANFFILPIRSALVLNSAVLLATVPLVLADPATGVRVLSGLWLVCVFGYVFARQIEQQRHVLQHMALVDPLTGIGNRRALEIDLQRIVDEQRYGIRASLIMFDLDDFKDVNDLHGHAAGDGVIRMLATAVQTRLRHADRLYRYGGEEFVVVCRHIGVRGAARLAESLRQLIVELDHGEVGRITASFGAAEWRKSESPEAWLARADSMMYRAKELGRNCVCYDSEPDPATVDKVRYLAEAQAMRLAGR